MHSRRSEGQSLYTWIILASARTSLLTVTISNYINKDDRCTEITFSPV